VDTAAEIQWADELLSEARSASDLYCIIESNEGLRNVDTIAASTHRLKALFFGGFDMSAALGAKMAWEPLLYARGRSVHAAAMAGIEILDSPYLDLNDEVGLVSSARAAQDLGFVGKAAKHPSQIATINSVFTPDTATLARAERIVAAFNKDPSATLVLDGKLIEKPTVRAMQRVLATAASNHRA
jgi:citrate lyase beta subunit